MSFMNWKALTKNSCPSCMKGALVVNGSMYECEFVRTPIPACDFRINRQKALDLVKKIKSGS